MGSSRKWNAREKLSAEAAAEHDPSCRWPKGEPCRRFSTDGTRLGAEIAHTMGTTDEREIAAGRAPNDFDAKAQLTGMAEEQADWESDEM